MSGLIPLFPFEHLAYKNTDNDEPDKCFINMYNEIFKKDSTVRLVKDKFDRNCIYPIINWYDVSFTIYFTGIQLIRTRVEGTQSPYVYWRENHKKIIEHVQTLKENYYIACTNYIWDKNIKFAKSFKVEWAIGTILYIIDKLEIAKNNEPITTLLNHEYELNQAKQIISNYVILDPFAGWGDRMYAANVLGIKKYIGFDPNTELIEGYDTMMLLFKQLQHNLNLNQTINDINFFPFEDLNIDENSNMENIQNIDFIITSIPLGSKEIYSIESTQSSERYRYMPNWIEFMKKCIYNMFKLVKVGGYVCINMNDYSIKSRKTHKTTNVTFVAKLIGYINSLEFTNNTKYEKIYLYGLTKYSWPMYIWKRIN